MIFVIIFLFGALSMAYRRFFTSKNKLEGKHVMVTGGSSGIGKAVAIECSKRGANVTILARNQELLDAAKIIIQQNCMVPEKQKIQAYSVDVSKNYSLLQDVVKMAEENNGPVEVLVNCAGTSIAGRFDEVPIEEFERMMSVNYFGSVNVTRCVLPSMKLNQKGNIIFVSSLAGLLGLYGYTAYSASKFALMGLAQALHMEVKPNKISVTISFPPDTDTPGFKEEQKQKPTETKLISESGGFFDAAVVAKTLLDDGLNGKFLSTVGLDGWMLSTLCCGMSPVSGIIELFTQVFSLGFIRLIGACILLKFNRIVRKCAAEREVKKKSH